MTKRSQQRAAEEGHVIDTGDLINPAVQEVRPGRSLNMLVVGDEAAPSTVFLCHGAGGSLRQWRFQLAALREAGSRIVAWDYPGHGDSPKPRERQSYAGAALLEDYAALLDRFGAGRIVLAAHSYGTVLTLALLSRLKAKGELGRVSGVLLLGPPGAGARLSASPLATTPLPLLHLMRPLLSRGFKRAAWDAGADPALVRHEQRATRGNRLSMMAALMSLSLAVEREELAGLELPVTILAGASDQLTPPQGAKVLAEHLPRASLEVLAGCGHQIMLEKPEVTNRALLSLLQASKDGDHR